ncbi:MAG: SDR family oxidoreductase [Bacteroidia bacterium]
MKNVVVTGASKGIGLAIAQKFASEDYNVAICARDQKYLEEAAEIIKSTAKNSKTFSFVCDVSKAEERTAFAEFVNKNLGETDILVNNAGIFIPGQIHNEEEGILEIMLQTNVHSAYHFSRLFLPAMMKRKSGHIFNMCSTASITAYTNGGSYCISKYALYGMTKVLREELKPFDIKVTAILPGATLTNSWSGTDLPEERFMKAEDVAEAVFMCSQLSPGAVIEEILMRPQLGDI